MLYNTLSLMASRTRVIPQPAEHNPAFLLGQAISPDPDNTPEYADKPWIEAKIIQVITIGLRGRPATIHPGNPQPRIERNPTLALSALWQLARLKGYVVEKKQSLAGKIDLGKLSPGDLRAVLEGSLDQLAPGERQRLLDIASGVTIGAETIEQ